MMLLGTSCGLSDPHHNVDGECGHTISTSDGGSCSMVVTVRYNSYNGGRGFSLEKTRLEMSVSALRLS